MKDPFSMVYTALWDLAEAYDGLTELIKIGNRIRYDSDNRQPEKRTTQDADMPELILTTTGLSANIWDSSSTSKVVRRYSWIAYTGDYRVDCRLFPVEWALFVAMHGYKQVLNALEYRDARFCKRTNILDVINGVIRPEHTSQVAPRGWSAVWACEVEMHFQTNMIEELLA